MASLRTCAAIGLGMLCLAPTSAFVPGGLVPPLLQFDLSTAIRHSSPSGSLSLMRPAATRLQRDVTRRQRGSDGMLRMCGGHGLLHTISLIGASLPDTPITTNLGVPSPVVAHQVLFLLSNVGYFLAGAAILRTRSAPKTMMGVSLGLVGVASCLFHYFQCVMPVGSPLTTAFCFLDSTIACSMFLLFSSQCWDAVRNPTPRFLIGWPLAFLFYAHAGSCYTVTHALWHLATAYLAYGIVADRDDVVAQPTRRQLPLTPALLKRRVGALAALGKKQWDERAVAVRSKWREVKRIYTTA